MHAGKGSKGKLWFLLNKWFFLRLYFGQRRWTCAVLSASVRQFSHHKFLVPYVLVLAQLAARWFRILLWRDFQPFLQIILHPSWLRWCWVVIKMFNMMTMMIVPMVCSKEENYWNDNDWVWQLVLLLVVDNINNKHFRSNSKLGRFPHLLKKKGFSFQHLPHFL